MFDPLEPFGIGKAMTAVQRLLSFVPAYPNYTERQQSSRNNRQNCAGRVSALRTETAGAQSEFVSATLMTHWLRRELSAERPAEISVAYSTTTNWSK